MTLTADFPGPSRAGDARAAFERDFADKRRRAVCTERLCHGRRRARFEIGFAV